MRTSFLIGPFLFSVLAAAAACGGGGNTSSSFNVPDGAYSDCIQTQTASIPSVGSKETPKGPFAAALLEADKAALASVVREDLKHDMRASLEAERVQQLAFARCAHLRAAQGTEQDGGTFAMPSAADRSSEGSGAREVSGTNNQIAGVDEADFVKNDTKYIYVVSGSTLRIVEAWPATSAREIGRATVPGVAKKLFVEGDRALVYSATPRRPRFESSTGSGAGTMGDVASHPSTRGECTYGYNGCVPQGDGTETEISIFDIADRAAPRLVRSIHSTSSLIAARRIGRAVHTVLGEASLSTQIGWTRPSLREGMSEAEIHAAYDAAIRKSEEDIARVDVDAILPRWTDSTGAAPDVGVYQSGMPDGAALTSVLSLDLGGAPAIKVASVISKPGWVYASADALYIAVPHSQISGWGWYDGRTEKELSTIHKFSIGAVPGATRYVASGLAKGRVLNQFALDEHEGHLRVATTTGHLPSPDAHNTLSVLAQQGGSLEVVGQVDNIARTEDIRSVRFDGPRGYVVTFKKTDPLYVFDLADPRAPKISGELKIPGFSTYMHMIDPTHLLTIGYDAADQGDFAFFTGVLLQIFDVTNPADPRLAHKEVIGTRGSSSEALTNHLAFNYFAPKSLLALPMTVCEGGGTDGTYGTRMTFSGLMVYDATVAGGFALRGKVAHPSASPEGQNLTANSLGYHDVGCSSWWTNATSEVKRSIVMDDYVFSVSETRIKVNALGALATDVREIGLK